MSGNGGTKIVASLTTECSFELSDPEGAPLTLCPKHKKETEE